MKNKDRMKKTAHYMNYDEGLPDGVLDIIRSDYPDRYNVMLEDSGKTEALFSEKEWIDILMKSRSSFESHISRAAKARKHLDYIKGGKSED